MALTRQVIFRCWRRRHRVTPPTSPPTSPPVTHCHLGVHPHRHPPAGSFQGRHRNRGNTILPKRPPQRTQIWVTQMCPPALPGGVEEASGVWGGGETQERFGGQRGSGLTPKYDRTPSPGMCHCDGETEARPGGPRAAVTGGGVGHSQGGWVGGSMAGVVLGGVPGFVGSLLRPSGLGERFYVSFSGVPKWEGMREGVLSQFGGRLCGGFWGAVLGCQGTGVSG